MTREKHFIRLLFICICPVWLVACGDGDPGAVEAEGALQTTTTAGAQDNPESPEESMSSSTGALFDDLPDASEVPDDEMGDLYFQILTRLATKVRAVRNEKAAQSTRELIVFARQQAQVLDKRAAALPDEERSLLFQNSIAQVNYAKTQYAKAVKRIGQDDPQYLKEFAAFASKPWPSLN